MAPGSSSISGSSRGSAGPTTIIRTTGTVIRTVMAIPTDMAMGIRMAPAMGTSMAPGMDMIPALTAAHITAVKTATILLTTIRAATILLIMIETVTVLTIGPPSQQKLPTSRTNWRQQVITMYESTASWGRRHVMRWSVIRAPRGWSRAEI